ncbi:Uncharacterised protein [Mycobacteroides abscessus subsp. abscessus]|nr:Uncharacterised protein [Mycobacteroides abscessus subsp. abscessus]
MPERLLVGPCVAALVEHVAQTPSVVRHPGTQHHIRIESTLGHPHHIHVLVTEQLAEGHGVVEGGHAQRGNVRVGAGELQRAPQRDVLAGDLVVGDEVARDERTCQRVITHAVEFAGRTAKHIAQVRLVDQFCAPVMLAVRQSHVHIQPIGLGDLGTQELPERLTRGAANDLAENESERGHVVTLGGSGLPPRSRPRDVLAHLVPVGRLLRSQPGTRADHTRAVPEHHRQRDGFLTALAEFRPVARDGSIQIEHTALDEHVNAGAHQALGSRIHRRQGVFRPRAGARLVGPAGPQVDDEFPVNPDRYGRTQFVVLQEVQRECAPDVIEIR